MRRVRCRIRDRPCRAVTVGVAGEPFREPRSGIAAEVGPDRVVREPVVHRQQLEMVTGEPVVVRDAGCGSGEETVRLRDRREQVVPRYGGGMVDEVDPPLAGPGGQGRGQQDVRQTRRVDHRLQPEPPRRPAAESPQQCQDAGDHPAVSGTVDQMRAQNRAARREDVALGRRPRPAGVRCRGDGYLTGPHPAKRAPAVHRRGAQVHEPSDPGAPGLLHQGGGAQVVDPAQQPRVAADLGGAVDDRVDAVADTAQRVGIGEVAPYVLDRAAARKRWTGTR